ncbi:HemK2/MTQ2 family protein methyltransferase [Streptomyces ficellus]|uniref:Methyltransferase domain-containing protein n=1 Tax=Streptomyces ficellus TaxID=1977088 RepID=A0A6I6FRK8_9ACTN|nr:HemK2/MTQ2 family protein methyltransferase [Streptomyces ficellus]QGV82199.1 methyltransferase domain-containing protein [Streptomyces ficellus]
MRLLRPRGVYAPQEDTELLAQAARSELRALCEQPRVEVLDVGTGTGALALMAAECGAARVTAVDISWRAVLAARYNAWRLGLPVVVRHGDLTGPVSGRRFDLILSNPPYVLSPRPLRRGAVRTWNAGVDGRQVIDRLCDRAPGMLTDAGVLLLVQSALSGVDATLERLQDGGLTARVELRTTIPFGPVMARHADWLEEQGLIEPEERKEDLVVIRAQRT